MEVDVNSTKLLSLEYWTCTFYLRGSLSHRAENLKLPLSSLSDLLSSEQHVNPYVSLVSDDVADINMSFISVTSVHSSQFTQSIPLIGAESYSDMTFTLHTKLLLFPEKRTTSGI